MQTAGGIELDLSKSKFKYKLYDFIFYFSSNFYLEKFKNSVKDYITYENARLFAKYKINCSFNRFLALSYYKKLEKRGFLIEDCKLNKKYSSSDEFLYDMR